MRGRYEDDITPARVIVKAWGWFPVAVIITGMAMLLGGVVILVGWTAAGWFQSHDITRNYSNTVNSPGYQQNLMAEMLQHESNISGPGGLAASRASVPASSPEQEVLRAQELNELVGLCSEAFQFNPQAVPGGQQLEATVINVNCANGSPVADPPLAPSAS